MVAVEPHDYFSNKQTNLLLLFIQQHMNLLYASDYLPVDYTIIQHGEKRYAAISHAIVELCPVYGSLIKNSHYSDEFAYGISTLPSHLQNTAGVLYAIQAGYLDWLASNVVLSSSSNTQIDD
jgi:hypothetical protein